VEAVVEIERRRRRVDHASAHDDGVVLGGLLAEYLEALARVPVQVRRVVGDRELAERIRPLLLLRVAQILPVPSERLLRHEVDVEGLAHDGLQALEAAGVAELLGLRQDLGDGRVETLDRLRRRLLGGRTERTHRQDEGGDGGDADACGAH